jgi:hypothetical protein
VILDSKKAGQLTAGDPVLFRGYRVGSVEKAPLIRKNDHQLSAVHQCAKRSSGHQQRPLLERQRDRGRSDLGGDAR